MERVFALYPMLRNIKEFEQVLRIILPFQQLYIPFHLKKPWSALKQERELSWVLEIFIIELLKLHGEKLKRTPTIEEMDKVFQKANCCTLSYLISSIGLFEGTYQKLLIQAGLTPNHKTRENIRRICIS